MWSILVLSDYEINLASLREVDSTGFDTPVTVTFGLMTAYFGTAATVTGVFAAGLNSFAGGNLSAINSFNESHLVGLGAFAVSSKIPSISSLQEVIAGLSEQAASVVAKAKEACQ